MSSLTLNYKKELERQLIENDVTTIFGYGSLIWKQDFPVKKIEPGFIKGFKRRFWLASEDHRGTKESPGRVVSLYKEDTEIVHGVAIEIKDDDRKETLRHLAWREKGGYQLKMVDFYKQGTETCELVAVFLGEEDGILSCKNEAIEITANVIKTSAGPSGHNIDYFKNLVSSLKKVGLPEDQYLSSLNKLI